MRDFNVRPYSADEKRVVEWFGAKGLEGGDDPIGSLIFECQELRAEIRRLQADKAALLSGWEDSIKRLA